jgi:peptidyl-dipeptidase Dcp
MTNPFLSPWTTAFDIPPFADINDAHFKPAFEMGLQEGRAAIKKIAETPEAPTFENTIEAILADYSSEITANSALFERIETLWNTRDDLGLNDEQMRVLMLTRRSFVRSGAQLSDDDKTRMAKIKSRLSTLGTEFSQNLLGDESEWFLELTEADLDGLPEFVIDAMRAAGADKKCDGPCLTTSRSLFVPFLQFSARRDLREAVFHAWKSRGARGKDNDNRGHAAEILKLREERAKLLGYESFAAYKLETQMAKTPEAVRNLLMEVWTPAKAAAEKDGAILEQMLHDDGHAGPLEPWDWRYYSEKRRKIEHDLDEAELKPYLQLDRMIEAAFSCAARLFNLSFEPLDVTLYHEDVRGWNVTRDGDHIAVFIGDYFARGSKRSGAWCTAMRSQQKLSGNIRPIVLNVCNFAKASGDKPNLLSYDDARTLFHEFGHALHQMLSDVTYESISGTSVARDFVELPSQLYEHWLEVPEVLQEFATHADTGEAMPADMLKRLLDAQTYDQGYTTVGYVASALTDLNFHDGDAPADPMQSQTETLDQLGMPKATTMFHEAPHFQHVFAGDGYSCGYYSYMWSEVMDADAFDAFKEAGPFDRATAAKLEKHILSAGGSADPERLYTAFRGRMPGPEAMLKGRGLA